MTVQLTNQMRLQISAAAATLHPHVREQIVRSIMRTVASGPQPPGMNEVLRSIAMAQECIPASAVLISRCVGDTNDENDFRKRYY
jgi:hypothetical protein